MSAVGAVQIPPPPRVEPARFGVWLFLVGDAMFFAALVAGFVVLREGSSTFGGPGGASNLRAVAVGTLGLLLASLCVSRATVALARGRDERIVVSWVRRAILFGGLFLALQAIELRDLLGQGISPRTNLYWSAYFVLTSVHAVHVLAALVWSAVVWSGLSRGTHQLGLRLSALYWHFVGAVWLVLLALLHL